MTKFSYDGDALLPHIRAIYENAPPDWTDEQLEARVQSFLAEVARDHPELCEEIHDRRETLH